MSEWPQLPASLNHEILGDMSHQVQPAISAFLPAPVGKNKSFEIALPR